VPWDFFYTFNNVSGENLNWFWNAWFFSNNYIDLAIDNIQTTSNAQQVIISNIGGFPVPVDLQLNFTDGTTQVIHKSPRIWASGQKQVSIDVSTKKPVQSAKLITDIYVDADESNDIKTK
jgi:hypothetical protein